MKKYLSLFLVGIMSISMLAGCGSNKNDVPVIINGNKNETETVVPEKIVVPGIRIELNDNEILIDDIAATQDETSAVYVANDIIYYEDGHDFTYGEGDENDAHSKEEADKHVVVHITKPGDYVLSGTLTAGQIAIDLGKDSKEDPEAVVNLYLNGVNITNTVAPGVIFYNVYEPFNDVTEETATRDVDTSKAGANVFVVDGTENNVSGSYVARIYKADSVVLSEDGKSVEDAKKLHKYDAAFYSKTTMNINGYNGETGILNIKAENEGLDSEMHLTINGGIVNIESGNDGINTNEDGISVTTINGGILNILVNGKTGEGDGIDSNGWLIINGGLVSTQACGFSMDAGIDSDMGIHINGGTVIASGNMLDAISESKQNFVVFNFEEFIGRGKYYLLDSEDNMIMSHTIENDFSSLVFSSDKLIEGDYTLWIGEIQLQGAVSENMMGGMGPGGFGGRQPNGMMGQKDFEGKIPEGFDPNNMKPGNFDPNNMKPDMGGMIPFENFDNTNKDFNNNEMPSFDMNNFDPSQFEGGRPDNMSKENIELSEIFSIKNGANYFSFVGIKI